MNDTIKVVKEESAPDAAKKEITLDIKPYGRKSFPAYLIKGSSDSLPGIPTCETLLQEQEDKNKYKYKLARIRITPFANHNGSLGVLTLLSSLLIM